MSLEKQLSNEYINAPTKTKIRIYAQVFAYERRKAPEIKMEKNEMGIIMPIRYDYSEYECPQVAVNINALHVKEKDLDQVLKGLTDTIKKQMRDKGLVL